MVCLQTSRPDGHILKSKRFQNTPMFYVYFFHGDLEWVRTTVRMFLMWYLVEDQTKFTKLQKNKQEQMLQVYWGPYPQLFFSILAPIGSRSIPEHYRTVTTPYGSSPRDQDPAMFFSCFAAAFGMGQLWSLKLASAPSRRSWGPGKGERLAWKGWCSQLEFAWIFSPATQVGCENGATDS